MERRNPTPLLALALLLIAPTVSAAWFEEDGPLVIRVAPFRVGDRLLYESSELVPEDDSDGGPRYRVANGTTTYLIEGPSTASDAYGYERDTIAILSEEYAEGELTAVLRCHGSGMAAVRVDVLGGSISPVSSSSSSWGSLGAGPFVLQEERSATYENSTTFFPQAPCIEHALGAGGELLEGSTLKLSDLVPEIEEPFNDATSRPAVREDFHGRSALRFAFDLSEIFEGGEGSVELVFADGLPGAVLLGESELLAYEPGDGAVVADMGSVPARNPGDVFVPWAPLAFDDSAFALKYPYASAFAEVQRDPKTRLWFDEHPDAFLSAAFYQDPMSWGTGDGAGWLLIFSDPPIQYLVLTSEVSGAEALDPLRSTLPKPTWAASESAMEEMTRPDLPEVLKGDEMARLALESGVVPGDVDELAWSVSAWSVGGATWQTVSVSAKSDGRGVFLDVERGGRHAETTIESVEYSGGLLGATREGSLAAAPSDASTFATLVAPATGTGLAVEAATGAALLGLLVKFLVIPLYTRLVRARLLDHPVRARLFERIRAEPGIHRADLVEFAGCGDGATRHHLRQLVKHRMVIEVGTPGFARYFVMGDVPPDVARGEAVLRAGSNRRVYDLLVAEPGLSLREAGARLGMSAPSVWKAKKALDKAGLLPAARQVVVSVR